MHAARQKSRQYTIDSTYYSCVFPLNIQAIFISTKFESYPIPFLWSLNFPREISRRLKSITRTRNIGALHFNSIFCKVYFFTRNFLTLRLWWCETSFSTLRHHDMQFRQRTTAVVLDVAILNVLTQFHVKMYRSYTPDSVSWRPLLCNTRGERWTLIRYVIFPSDLWDFQ